MANLQEDLQTSQTVSLGSWLNSSHCIKSYPYAKRGIHTREADASWYKLESSSLLGSKHCSMLPLFLCQNYLFIFLFWSRLGLSISDLALADSVYPCCHSLSDGVQFLNLHRFSLTLSWHALFLICNVLTVHQSHSLQPCHISSCSSYRFPFPAALLSTACTLLNIQNTALEGAISLPLTRWSTAPPVCQAGTVNFKEGSIGPQANGSKEARGFMCNNCTRWGVTQLGHCTS